MKKYLAVIFVVLSIVALFCGCTSAEEKQAQREQEIAAYNEALKENGWREMIAVVPQSEGSSRRHLVYDAETFVVYYSMEYAYDHKAAAYLCPFYSENGYLCRYNPETQQIEEIVK